jgi:hypothetical protein
MNAFWDMTISESIDNNTTIIILNVGEIYKFVDIIKVNYNYIYQRNNEPSQRSLSSEINS